MEKGGEPVVGHRGGFLGWICGSGIAVVLFTGMGMTPGVMVDSRLYLGIPRIALLGGHYGEVVIPSD